MRLYELEKLGRNIGIACTSMIAFVVLLCDVLALRLGRFSPYILFPLDDRLALAVGYATSVLAIIAGAPLLIYYRRLNNMINTIPSMLHDVVSAMQSGAPLIEALHMVASTRAYGDLARVMGIVVSRLELGDPPEEAMMEIAREARHRYLEKLAYILTYAHYAGEKALDMLKRSARMYEEIVNMRLNYVNKLRPYIMTIGFMFFVYLFSSYVIVKMFMPSLSQAGGLIRIAGIQEMVYSLYWLGYIICLFTGAFYTRMVYGSYTPGLVYSALLLLAQTVFFSLFIFGRLSLPLIPAAPGIQQIPSLPGPGP